MRLQKNTFFGVDTLITSMVLMATKTLFMETVLLNNLLMPAGLLSEYLTIKGNKKSAVKCKNMKLRGGSEGVGKLNNRSQICRELQQRKNETQLNWPN